MLRMLAIAQQPPWGLSTSVLQLLPISLFHYWTALSLTQSSLSPVEFPAGLQLSECCHHCPPCPVVFSIWSFVVISIWFCQAFNGCGLNWNESALIWPSRAIHTNSPRFYLTTLPILENLLNFQKLFSRLNTTSNFSQSSVHIVSRPLHSVLLIYLLKPCCLIKI